MEMQGSPQPTQATQPFENPRRQGRNVSDISPSDLADIICILHPNSPAAFEAVQATMLVAPQHILQNDDLQGITQEDLDLHPDYSGGRDIALRLSSRVKKKEHGFTFGRNSRFADIVLAKDPETKLVSNTHFKIYINQQGSLMIQDTSTNGTVVDDNHLRHKDRYGRHQPRMASLALQNGALISLMGPNKTEIKLMLRVPHRGDYEEAYETNLRKYLEARGQVAQFASMRESQFGNRWNGGNMYNFSAQLGKGAFALVFKVQTKSEGKIFAAKEIDKRKFVKNGVLDIKFDSELKIMERLRHPNIVKYINCHTHEHWIYIIMEYVPYGELSKEMEKRGSIPEPMVQSITVQILSALKYLHRRNIVHRDIKPDNILIASRDPFIVKLSDFGLSKCVKNEDTFLKTFCGTLLYCAPEIYPDYLHYQRGAPPKRRRLGEPVPRSSPYDQSVDMWSFGAVLFHILCGRAPIIGRNDDRGASMLANIMTKDVDFSPLRALGVSDNAINFIARLLNRNPHLRPKEDECSQHPWIKDVKHPLGDVEDLEPLDDGINQALEIVEEEDIDDDEERAALEAARDLEQLTAVDPAVGRKIHESRTPKRPRLSDINTTTDILYPILPSFAQQNAELAPHRLFGEIDPSTMKSSGVLGVPDFTTAAVRQISNEVEQISVNDFVETNDDHFMAEAPVSAASLEGAEAQIGHLNMASPGATSEGVGTPDTTHPITPQARDMSPANIQDVNPEREASGEEPEAEDPIFHRHINLALLADESFAKTLEARNVSRAQKVREKAASFHAAPNTFSHSIELAKTVNGRLDQPASGFAASNGKVVPRIDRTIRLPDIERTKPPGRFGRLISVPGSFTHLTIPLDYRVTTWGRGAWCSVRHPDGRDLRIPKTALKILFWAPGVEVFESPDGNDTPGKDWTRFPGLQTIIATSASKCIWVNGVELKMKTPKKDAALYGKIYTGDIITIYKDSKDAEEFLKFEVEITFGDSARRRPPQEAGFQVRKETTNYHRYLLRESVRLRALGDSGNFGWQAAI